MGRQAILAMHCNRVRQAVTRQVHIGHANRIVKIRNPIQVKCKYKTTKKVQTRVLVNTQPLYLGKSRNLSILHEKGALGHRCICICIHLYVSPLCIILCTLRFGEKVLICFIMEENTYQLV